MSSKNTHIPMDMAHARLSKIWFIGSGTLYIIITLFSIIGTYDLPGDQGNEIKEVFAWLVPLTVPTLTLIVGVLGAAATGEKKDSLVKKSFVVMSGRLSAFYLFAIFATIMLIPFSGIENPVEFYTTSNFWLTPLQGVAIAALGYLFTTGKKDEEQDQPQEE